MFKHILLGCVFLTSASLYAQTLNNGEVSSRDLLTKDINASERFYTQLFGWQSKKVGKYIQLNFNYKLVANLVQIDLDKQAQWMPQFAHNNLTQAKTEILKNGGTILKEATEKSNGNKYILLKDTQGALCVLTDDISKEKEAAFPALNEWLWDELWTHDIPGSQKFYTDLFTYEIQKLETGYIIFMKQDKWKTGLLENPFEQSQTQWVSTIRVDDPQAICDKAVSLGAKVLVSVDENKGHREAALISDPSGAVFIVEKYEEK